MRTRRWVLYLLVLILFSTLFVIQGWRFLKANERIKTYILAELQPVLGEKFDIEKIRIRLGNVHLWGVYFPSPDGRIVLKIQDLRVGYNLFRVLSRGFDPHVISQDVLVVNPKLYILAGALERSGAASDIAAEKPLELENELQNSVRRFAFIKRLSVKQGEIFLIDNQQAEVRIAHSVEGWLVSSTTDTMRIRLVGSLFDSQSPNLFITGKTDMRQGAYTVIRAELQKYDLMFHPVEVSPSFMRFSRGLVNGHMAFESFDAGQNLEVSGELQIQDAAAVTSDSLLTLEDIDVDLVLRDGDILIRNATQNVNTDSVSVSGRITDVLHPEITIDIAADRMHLSNFGHIFGMAGKLQGVGSLRAKVTGSVKDPEISARLVSPSFLLDNLEFENFTLNTVHRDGILFIERSGADLFHNRFVVDGTIDLTSERREIDGSITGSGDLLPLLRKNLADSLLAVPTWVEATISGDVKNPALFGNCGLDLVVSGRDSSALKFAFSFRDFRLRLVTPEGNGSADISGTIDLAAKPAVFSLDLSRCEDLFLTLFDLPREELISRYTALFVRAFGTFDEYTVDTEIKGKEAGEVTTDVVQVNSTVRHLSGEIRSYGDVILHPETPNELRGSYMLLVSDGLFQIKQLILADSIRLVYQAKKQENGPSVLDGELVIDDFDLADLSSFPDSSYAGTLNLHMDIAGSDKSPALKCSMSIDSVYYKDAGPYDCHISFEYDEYGLRLDEFLLGSGESTLLFAGGRYDAQADSLSFEITGAGFDAGAFTGRKTLTGPTLVDVKVGGSLETPDVRGLVAVKKGEIAGVPFDELEVRLGNGEKSRHPELHIGSMRLTRDGEFELVGTGSFPFRRHESLNLSVTGEGNFLAALPDLDDWFRNTRSDGIFRGQITGTPVRPVLERSTLSFTDGAMEFGSVIPPVTELAGEFEFRPDSQIVHIKTLEGKMGGRAFRITNRLADARMSPRPLEDMVVGSSGFNLGVFVVETPGRGVPLNFAGLMEPGVYGILDLRGREDSTRFYLAGPSYRPVIRGRIDLYDTELMYPFYEGVGGSSEPVRRFLYSLEWDVLVTPMDNVRYVKTFPAAIDEAYVNLQLDDRYGGLEFLGQLDDESWRITGEVRSTTGFIEYLDLNFRVERAGADFDLSSLMPVVYGQARTTVTDSLGMPTDIFLTLQTVDSTMTTKSVDDIIRLERERARWDEIRFKLTSNNPNFGTSEEQVMASLGYSGATLPSKAFDAIGLGTESYLLRPLFRPVERKIEQIFSLDYVRFSSRFTRNLIDFNLNNNIQLNSRLALLRNTRVILGKYIASRFFLQYTGQVEAGIEYRYKEKSVGLHHTFGLEYRINPQLLLELEYDYDSLMWYNRDDKRILLRHWFPF